MSSRSAATPPLHHTLILGAAKSGTTALFYAIQKSMEQASGSPVKGLFEPRDMDAFKSYFETTQDPARLCKALLGPVTRRMTDALDEFDRKIIIFRDPRDNVVSRLLFNPPRLLDKSGPEKNQAFLDLIKQKEEAPDSISVLGILREVGKLTDRSDLPDIYRKNAIIPAVVKRKWDDAFFMFSYEDLLTQSFGALGDYLGLDMTSEFEVADKHEYVSRSKGSGEWKAWFHEEDVAYFANEVADDYRLLGFDPAETPDAAPSIDPATASEYVVKQIKRHEEKRAMKRRKRMEQQEAAS
ncbi:hypothetical protein KUV51_21250 [Tateyamaria omphalii]|uniref:hypothetical protein n=1 Tax=Tateyamaria omphalii TaxID=299262 RepID=UPI001C9952B5|nr:hypothetical protein [Tateyamaria omphalii]MBY5935549.1 hypothetical protein [Tateyamaria omphalii]